MEYNGIYKIGQTNDDVRKINIKLYSIGYLERYLVNNLYSSGTANAVKRYQSANNMQPTGQIDENTFDSLFNSSLITEYETNELSQAEYDGSYYGRNNPNSFWNVNNDTLLRQNDHEIKILYGVGNKAKILKHVIFKSKQQVISPDDGGIEDVYEFIARDMEEREDG